MRNERGSVAGRMGRRGMSRREWLRAAAAGAAGVAGAGLFGPSPAVGAVGGGHNGNLAAVTAQLTGTGLYIDREFTTWSETTRQANLKTIRSWGFRFICPKVGSSGTTWYSSDSQLRGWRSDALAAGLGFAPFIYSIPSTSTRDAQICSELGNDSGIVVVDMEDEYANSNAAMANFGSVFRGLNPNTPIVVTGYGDPIYTFGATGWPYSQMAYWADAYSPQWYVGTYAVYQSEGVDAAINWADAQCGQAFGSSYPNCPSFWTHDDYASSGTLPLADITACESYGKAWKAPIFWWEYAYMTPAIVKAIFG